MIYQLGNRQPELVGDEHFIAENATVIGSVTLHHQCSVWYNAVIRADNDTITIGEQSNIQDGAVLHTDPGFKLTIGQGVTVGHKAMLHGCTVGDHSLIGINAVVLNGATIGKHCLIGANALVTENSVIPDSSVVMGSPGKIVRQMDEAKINALKLGAQTYVANLKRYSKDLQAINT
ncbi:MAG: gamma carbonic anhydrase family protein [Endozoicomonas sp.]